MHILAVYGNTVRCFCLFCTAVERDGHSDAAGSRCVAAEGFCSRQEMAPKKRKKPAAGDGATPERISKRAKKAGGAAPTQHHFQVAPHHLALPRERRSNGANKRHGVSVRGRGPARGGLTTHCSYAVLHAHALNNRAGTRARYVQEGAALAEHVDDLVSINDTFVAQVKRGRDSVRDINNCGHQRGVLRVSNSTLGGEKVPEAAM